MARLHCTKFIQKSQQFSCIPTVKLEYVNNEFEIKNIIPSTLSPSKTKYIGISISPKAKCMM
jgi:hypothetical protein